MDRIKVLSISIKVKEKTSLYILLHQDGTINRQGYGTFDFNSIFCIGITETNEMLKELSSLIDSEFESYLNRIYDLPNQKGNLCSTEINLETANGIFGIKFNYGSESIGPPEAVHKLILKAIELTDSWYKVNNTYKKKWWQIWK